MVATTKNAPKKNVPNRELTPNICYLQNRD
jgi:hypothetical protein